MTNEMVRIHSNILYYICYFFESDKLLFHSQWKRNSRGTRNFDKTRDLSFYQYHRIELLIKRRKMGVWEGGGVYEL